MDRLELRERLNARQGFSLLVLDAEFIESSVGTLGKVSRCSLAVIARARI
jgi:hypothetical protein